MENEAFMKAIQNFESKIFMNHDEIDRIATNAILGTNVPTKTIKDAQKVLSDVVDKEVKKHLLKQVNL